MRGEQMRFLLFTLLILAPIAVFAEGRNDPFLQCDFESGRQVVLVEDGDALEWREEDHTGPMQCTLGATVICITDHPEWGPQALVVTNGASEIEERMSIAPGSALLNTVWFGPEVMQLSQDNGRCERIGR